MTDLTLTFPPIPENADKSIIKPTKAFNKSIYKVTGIIIGFVLVYIFLLISVVLIAIGWGWLGYVLITGSNNILMMVLGAAFIPSGLILLYFLSKFIFVRTLKAGKGYEIKEQDHPQLFSFIKKVAKETGVKSPKHIYFTPDVNASASLEVNLVNTFLPGRKDLNLGLALINAINMSEFKAVLAHEFGHFSQVSMRIGLYVHKLNKALYNMLYENKSYHKALNLLRNWHWTISLPIILNSYIIKCIQAILRKFYWVINKSYMELSRESEFHADAIASYLSGSNNVISLFEKYDVARYCYDQTMELLYSGIAENKKSENLYTLHSWLLRQYQDDIKVAPIFKPQVRIDDPWSSHPSSEDREKYLYNYSLLAPVLEKSPWTLFNNPETVQREFTARLYGATDQATQIDFIDNTEFEKAFFDTSKNTSYNQIYNGYYDNRFITPFNIQETILTADNDHMPFETLLSNEHCNLPKVITALSIDINTLQRLIENPNNDIRSFDYKGIKHYFEDAESIKAELNQSLTEKRALVNELDRKIFKIFYAAAPTDELKSELATQYEKLFKDQADAQADYEMCANLKNAMSPTSQTMSYNSIYKVLENVYAIEKIAKKKIRKTITDKDMLPFVTEAERYILDNYIDKTHTYFLEPNYDNAAIRLFYQAVDVYIGIINKRSFHFEKRLLDFQLTLNHKK